MLRVFDEDETMSEAPWTTVTKGKEKEVWRLETEGEAEKSQVCICVSSVITKD